MSKDTIYREDAIEALGEEPYVWTDDDEFAQGERSQWIDDVSAIKAVPSADRPNEVIYGNEHNCIMTIFGECSYAETGCGDCAVVEKVRKALSADRPQGEWFKDDEGTLICSACGSGYKDQPTFMGKPMFKWCPLCGARMKGADDETEIS